MSQNVLFICAVATSVSLNLVAGFQYLKSRKGRSKPLAAAKPACAPARHELSLFPEGPDVTFGEVLCPLIEAEVYFVYGRKKDAEAVLALALRQGRITPNDVSRLRDKLDTERQIKLSLAISAEAWRGTSQYNQGTL